MKKVIGTILITVSAFAALAQTGGSDVGSSVVRVAGTDSTQIRTASCDGEAFNDRDSNQKLKIEIEIRGDRIELKAGTNPPRVYARSGGKAGWKDSEGRIRSANVYGQIDGRQDVYTDAISILEAGYSSADRSTGANVKFDLNGADYYGEVKCSVLR